SADSAAHARRGGHALATLEDAPEYGAALSRTERADRVAIHVQRDARAGGERRDSADVAAMPGLRDSAQNGLELLRRSGRSRDGAERRRDHAGANERPHHWSTSLAPSISARTARTTACGSSAAITGRPMTR